MWSTKTSANFSLRGVAFKVWWLQWVTALQHSSDRNQLWRLLQRDLKTQERNKEVPRSQKNSSLFKTDNRPSERRLVGKKICELNSELLLNLNEMSVSNKCSPSGVEYLIAPWSFQHQANNTTEKYSDITSVVKQNRDVHQQLRLIDYRSQTCMGFHNVSHHLVIKSKFQ